MSSGSIAQFCEIAGTSSEERDGDAVDEYYQTLEAAAPEDIRDEVATLHMGWRDVSFPFGKAELEASDISRPAEVSEAARKVLEFVGDTCGEEGGVYLIFPEAGF